VDSSDAAINAIPQEVRVLNRSIPFCATKKEYALHSLLMDRGMDAGIAAPEAFYRREMTRMVGPCTFDYAIEFTGQSRLYALLFAHMRETKKIVWMHGAFEQEENPEQKQVQQSYLSIYPYVDRIVGCSKYIKDANFENFATPATQGKYTYMESLINVKKIRKELDENIFVDIDEKRYVILEGGNKKQSFLSVRILPAPGKEYLNFVTVGKLIPENNQITLIRAFARLHREDGNVRLYICGEGMARTDLKAVILEEQLEDAVYLVGKTEHTLPLIGTCQCFVFPACSLENQPFIREVRMLKIPLILAENEAITDVPIKNGQILVKTDEDSLYEGMKKLIMEKVPQYNFEADDYNRQCYAKFEKILDM
jgi:CDP-glycerol glycerophosphotransferase